MSAGVRLAKGYNLFLMVMLAVQLAILLGIIVVLAYLGTGSVLSFLAIVSTVSLIVLCLPLSVMQYLSSQDRKLKILFGGFVFLSFFSAISGIAWNLAVVFPGFYWLPDFAKLLTLLTYLPVIISLLAVSSAKDLKIEPYNKAVFVFLCTVSAVIILLFTLVNIGKSGMDVPSAFIYTGSVIFDILILGLASLLILTHMPGKLRYLLSIILIVYMSSTIADAVALIDGLGMYEVFNLTSLIYSANIGFISLGLVVYSLGNVKIVTVEEVSKKLDDVTMQVSDFVAQSPLAICLCDTTGVIETANDRFLAICGRSRQDMTGKLSLIDVLPEVSGALLPGTGQAVVHDTITVDGLRVDRHGRAPAYFRVKIFPTHESDGKVASIVVILDDVTERKAFEDQLVNAKKQTELYVDLMGHDVNNMNQIAMGFLELAEDKIRENGQLSEADMFLLSKPIEALTYNSRLIYNIRKLQQEKAGVYQHEPVDVERVLASVVSRHSDVAGRDILISLTVKDKCAVMANELLVDVFGNLVGNAIKHSRGPVRIDVKMERIIAGSREYCGVTVEDDGPGISDAMKCRLFDRLAIDSTRKKGSGFGLCLSKMLVEEFGGRLEVEDRVQGDYTKGARFVVILPAIETAPREQARLQND